MVIVWCPPAASFLTVSGVAATRVSPGRVSAGMPMCMGVLLVPAVRDQPPIIQQRVYDCVFSPGGAMTVKVRRVVTGHDGKGRALVKIDEIAKNVISNRPGASSCVV